MCKNKNNGPDFFTRNQPHNTKSMPKQFGNPKSLTQWGICLPFFRLLKAIIEDRQILT